MRVSRRHSDRSILRGFPSDGADFAPLTRGPLRAGDGPVQTRSGRSDWQQLGNRPGRPCERRPTALRRVESRRGTEKQREQVGTPFPLPENRGPRVFPVALDDREHPRTVRCVASSCATIEQTKSRVGKSVLCSRSVSTLPALVGTSASTPAQRLAGPGHAASVVGSRVRRDRQPRLVRRRKDKCLVTAEGRRLVDTAGRRVVGAKGEIPRSCGLSPHGHRDRRRALALSREVDGR